MKQFFLHTLFLLLSLPCFSQAIVTMDVRTFKEEGDSLHLDYQVWVPASVVESAQGLRIAPLMEAGDSLLLLPRITILGKNKHKVLERYHQNSELGYPPFSTEAAREPYHFQIRVPYYQWMDSARLCIRQEVSGYRGSKVTTRYLLSDRVSLQAREPYRVNPHVSLIVPQKEEKRRRKQGKAYLDFQVGRSVILPNFRRNPEELLKINDAVQEVTTNQDAVLQGLYVEGFASPEGSYSLNERLSRERATALKDYIKNKFNLSDALFKVSSVAEDWDGLEALVQGGDYPNKEKILEIIGSTNAPDQKEVALKRLGASYRLLLKDVFPDLRRVEYQIDYTVKDYGLEKTKALLDKQPGNLSHLELFQLAMFYQENQDSLQYNRILTEIIPRYYAEDPTACNNAAAVLLSQGETITAGRLLEKSGNISQTINNRGILHLLKGELDQAQLLFQEAQRLGNKEARENLKEVELKRKDNQKMERYKNRD